HRSHTDALDVAPRVLVGLAFDEEGGADDLWHDLGAGALVLPRWTYWAHGGEAALTLTIAGAERPSSRAIAREVDAIFDALLTAEEIDPAVAAPEITRSSAEAWIAHVDRIRETLGSGAASKIVAARRAHAKSVDRLDPVVVLSRMEEAEGSVRYLVRRGSTTFLGCTPERLFTMRGRRLETEALAGSIAADEEDAEGRL